MSPDKREDAALSLLAAAEAMQRSAKIFRAAFSEGGDSSACRAAKEYAGLCVRQLGSLGAARASAQRAARVEPLTK